MTKDDRKKIADGIGRETFCAEPVYGGRSDARRYKVTASDGTWMVKLFHEKPLMAEWYELIRRENCPQLVCADICQPVGDHELCTATQWIEGECMEAYLLEHPDEAAAMGEKAAMLVGILHSARIREAALGIQYRAILAKKIADTMERIQRKQIRLPYFEEFQEFLNDAFLHVQLGPITLVHNDIRPANFVIKNDKLFLIDFENGGIGEYVQDFAALTMTTPPYFYPFLYGFIRQYMAGSFPNDFFKKNLMYSILYILMEAAWDDCSFQMDVLREKCVLLYDLYDGFTCEIPKWLRNMR